MCVSITAYRIKSYPFSRAMLRYDLPFPSVVVTAICNLMTGQLNRWISSGITDDGRTVNINISRCHNRLPNVDVNPELCPASVVETSRSQSELPADASRGLRLKCRIDLCDNGFCSCRRLVMEII